MLRMVARLSLRARTIPRRSPLTSVTPRAFHGDVGAGAHGDADIGLRQRGGVVDAVAGHGHDSALRLQAAHDFRFLLGQDFGIDFVDAELGGNGFGGGAAIAGEHDDADAFGVQLANALAAWMSLMGSATTIDPANRPSTATRITASPAPQVALRQRPGISTCSFSMKLAVSRGDARPSTVPPTP